jgi:hypothetical protein
MISILNFIFTIVFYPMIWLKLYYTCIYFKEFLNQLNLLYKYRMSTYAYLMTKKTQESENLHSYFFLIWMSYAYMINKNNL